jgi:hypothetical protein
MPALTGTIVIINLIHLPSFLGAPSFFLIKRGYPSADLERLGVGTEMLLKEL